MWTGKKAHSVAREHVEWQESMLTGKRSREVAREQMKQMKQQRSRCSSNIQSKEAKEQ
jgi:hypothetical protein